jgi:hypothetical protein
MMEQNQIEVEAANKENKDEALSLFIKEVELFLNNISKNCY